MTLSKFTQRRGFTLVELLVVIAIIGTLVGLLLPAVQSAREAANRSSCTNKQKQLSLALLNMHEVRRALPAGIDRFALSAIANSPAITTSGFSWITHALPFMEETALYNNMATATNKFAKSTATVTTGSNSSPFSPALLNTPTQHAATVQLPGLICPSFSGAPTQTTASAGGTGNATSFLVSGPTGLIGGNPTGVPAITNYKAMIGTHLLTGSTTIFAQENGAIQFRSPKAALVATAEATDTGPLFGNNLSAISDGTSKTILVSESKERGFSAWIDGMQTWVVANSGATAGPSASTTLPLAPGVAGNTTGAWLNAVSALNVGPSAANSGATFAAIPTIGSRIAQQIAFGPSSDHSGGLVIHSFVDGHVQAISADVDPTVYLGLASRATGEAVTDF